MLRFIVLWVVGKKQEKAYKWLKKGAETGNIYAQLACGDILQKYGHVDQAKYWWKKAAAQGNEKAKERLQKIYN